MAEARGWHGPFRFGAFGAARAPNGEPGGPAIRSAMAGAIVSGSRAMNAHSLGRGQGLFWGLLIPRADGLFE